MELVKKIAGIVITGAVTLGVVAAGISWFQMDPEDRSAILSTVGRSLAWLGIVLVLPWATYFISVAVGRRDSNGASAMLVAGYTLVDGLILGWLLGFHGHSTTAIIFAILGMLIALAYNLLACDWIAEKLG
jgi:FtsH-binding integral membrane protein